MKPDSAADSIAVLEQRRAELEADILVIRASGQSAVMARGVQNHSRALNEAKLAVARQRLRRCQDRAVLEGEILYLPHGTQTIWPSTYKRPVSVIVDEDSAVALEAQRCRFFAGGVLTYFDFNHLDGPRSFFPATFLWRPTAGVVAEGFWTTAGVAAVRAKRFCSFSPDCAIDRSRRLARICSFGNSPNMGGLTNNPAWAGIPAPSLNRSSQE